MPAAISSPRLALLPPKSAPSARRRSASGRLCAALTGTAGAVEDRHAPVEPSTRSIWPVPIRDGGAPGADHGRQPVLARDDRRVGHDPADVGDGRLDLGEDRRPGRRGDRADEDLAGADVGDLVAGLDHPGRTLDLARRGGRPRARGRVLARAPTPAALRGDAPEHHVIGSLTDSGIAPSAGGGVHSRELLEQLLAARDDRRPVVRARAAARRSPR